MLIEFRIQNFACFADEAALSLIATTDKRHLGHVRLGPRPGRPNVLRAAAIYGANGHGKTRLVSALETLKLLVIGDNSIEINDVPRFKLNAEATESPVRFQIFFRSEEVDYEYGLVVGESLIEQEWLYEKEKRQETMVFEREINRNRKAKDPLYTYNFGSKLKRAPSPINTFKTESLIDFLGATSPGDKTFLGIGFEAGLQRLAKPFLWFGRTLQIVNADANFSNLHETAAENPRFLAHINKHICNSDTGISKVKVKDRKVSLNYFNHLRKHMEEAFFQELENLRENQRITLHTEDGIAQVITRQGDKYRINELSTLHKGYAGDVPFSLEDESAGTVRLLDLYPMIFNAENEEKCYVVDELDRKLHPLLSRRIVDTFLNETSSQIIFTTHTSSLLDLDILRRDEIWFVQKDEFGASNCFSLDEFKTRANIDVRKGYLNGRFGGIPVF